MLQGNFRGFAKHLAFAFVLAGYALPAEAPVTPLTVCEVLRDLSAYEGKDIAILGRYSFRETGRALGEQACEPATPAPPLLALVENTKDAPKPPANFELDALALRRKFDEVRKRTSLGKFRFGEPDYDRWAVVFGRVQTRRGDDAAKTPANLVFRGDGVVVFLTAQQ